MTVITDYIATHPHPTVMMAVYDCLKVALPAAEERISYGMPAFWQGEELIYFAPMKRHLGLYPTSSGVAAVAGELATMHLVATKGSIHLPYDQPLPLALIRKLAALRLASASGR